MRHHNRILTGIGILTMLMFFCTSARSQALLYTMAADTSVPPLYVGQPAPVTLAYLWLDELMRDQTYGPIWQYIQSMTWNDTTQTIASYLYQIQDDNPISYYNWDDAGIFPHPYKADPSHCEYAFEKQVGMIDNGSTWPLLQAEVIADVTVTDTMCTKVSASGITSDHVLVNCIINDEIKGKWVPKCPDIYGANKKGKMTLGITPITVVPDTAQTGTCMQFDYSPEWKKNAEDEMSPRIGWWIAPTQEYIVLLNFIGVNTASFSTFPISFGHSCGMYAVVAGIVQDPNDDFGLGGKNLPLAEWKSAFRTKIYNPTHP